MCFLSPWIFYYIVSQAEYWKSVHDSLRELVAKVCVYDEAVEQNEQHLTADSSIQKVAVNKKICAAQSIQVLFWPMPDIFRHRHSNCVL